MPCLIHLLKTKIKAVFTAKKKIFVKMSEKKRSANFSSEENARLVDIVKQHQDVIENKRTDAVFNKKKSEEWEKVAIEFNSEGNCFRTTLALRTKYENLKKTTKKKFAAEKQQMYATGGGTSAPSGVGHVEETIQSMLTTQVTGFKAVYDSDLANLGNFIRCN